MALEWELMMPPASVEHQQAAKGQTKGWNQKGKGKGKGKGKDRTWATCDRRNACGFVTRIPQDDGKRCAVLAVAASISAGGRPNQVYPCGVTVLPAGHVGFLLSTAKIGNTEQGHRRFALDASNTLTILNRKIDLPGGCINEVWWESVRQLRAGLRTEVSQPAATHDEGSRGASKGHQAILFQDFPEMQSIARRLCQVSDELKDSESTENLGEGVSKWTVELLATDEVKAPTAYQPLASWDDLSKRRSDLPDAKGIADRLRARIAKGLPAQEEKPVQRPAEEEEPEAEQGIEGDTNAHMDGDEETDQPDANNAAEHQADDDMGGEAVAEPVNQSEATEYPEGW